MAQSNQPLKFYDSTGKPVDRMPDRILPAGCGVVFNDRREVLLQKRSDNGYWGLPGGVVDIGESVEQCVIREVLEETRLHVTVKRLIGIYSDPSEFAIMTYPDGNILHTVTPAFECEWQSGELGISEESTDVGYFPVDGLPENTLFSSQLRIGDAMTNRAEPFIR